ncbi:MAG: SGNH/GDSL hydrolase family protein [Gemmataceae bacterium]|nr:SGNH/GDSL hydrolase family protein [Gemmataceae bacterium]
MRRFLLCCSLIAALPASLAAAPPEKFEFKDGDRVVLLGNTLIEREQRHGSWETVLTALHPDKDITFRNLGWSGDTVWGEARARFGGPADGFKHLREHVIALKPTVLLVSYGVNESFAGESGLPNFQKGLDTLLDTLAQTKARIVILGPQDQEKLGPPLPDPTESNKNLRLYRDVLRKTAEKRGHAFVDLSELLAAQAPLTDNGIHLTDEGYRKSAMSVGRAVSGRTLPGTGDIDVEGGPDGGQFDFHLDTLPPLGGPFAQTLKYPGLKPGQYELLIDGKKVLSADAAAWAKGVRLPAGPDLEQLEQLRAKIIEKNQTYFHRWRPQNETYLFLFRKNEQGQNAKEIPEFDPLIEELEREIARLRVPATHQYELRREK